MRNRPWALQQPMMSYQPSCQCRWSWQHWTFDEMVKQVHWPRPLQPSTAAELVLASFLLSCSTSLCRSADFTVRPAANVSAGYTLHARVHWQWHYSQAAVCSHGVTLNNYCSCRSLLHQNDSSASTALCCFPAGTAARQPSPAHCNTPIDLYACWSVCLRCCCCCCCC